MGAWGENSFDNDTALDWVDGLAEKPDGNAIVSQTIEKCLTVDYLDQDVVEEAIAACEVVAIGFGYMPKLNEDARVYYDHALEELAGFDLKLDLHIVELAQSCLKRIMDAGPEQSELSEPEKWSGEEAQLAWQSAVKDLQCRTELVNRFETDSSRI